MRSLVIQGRALLAAALVPLVLAVAACTGSLNLGGLTPGQNLYQAHGYYNVALGAVVDYAESPNPNKTVVATATSINRQVAPALEYAQTVIKCAGGGLTIDNVIDKASCAGVDTTTANVLKQANLLRSAGSRILLLLGKGH